VTRKAHVSLPASPEIRSNLVPRELSKQEFGRRLQALMLAKDWNQSELARASGLGRDSISTYVRGQTFPTPKALRKLADALGVTTEELLPNSLMNALEGEFPAIELKQAAGHPDKAWLRINRAVPFAVAAQIIALINAADEAERG
jgi:transcriptional regulator with XRE-family HTH domain